MARTGQSKPMSLAEMLRHIPTDLLADLVEQMIDHLDARAGDPDLEAEVDCCPAGECGGVSGKRHFDYPPDDGAMFSPAPAT